MANLYTVTKEIRGNKYTAQFNGISASLAAIDNSYLDGTNITSIERLTKYLFTHNLVEPQLSINDFGADRIGETSEKIINGKKYVAQFKGIQFALKAIDNSYVDGTNNTSIEKLSKILLDKIIVEPEKLSIDDFETMEEFNEVIAFARDTMQGGEAMEEFNEVSAFLREVMQGNFREEKNTSTTKKGSKE